MNFTEYYSCSKCGSPLEVKSSVMPNGADIKSVLTPCKCTTQPQRASDRLTAWVAVVSLVINMVLLALFMLPIGGK